MKFLNYLNEEPVYYNPPSDLENKLRGIGFTGKDLETLLKIIPQYLLGKMSLERIFDNINTKNAQRAKVLESYLNKNVVYLLHFHDPISTHHTSQHYLGWADDAKRRISEHAVGVGARFTEVAKERNISFELVRLWLNSGRTYERKLKNQKSAKDFCRICNPSLESNFK